MPPVGAPDTQAPQGPPPPISVGSEASQHAAQLFDAANQRPLDQNVPAAGDQLAPPEEALPTDVMPGAVSVPVVPATPHTGDMPFAPKPIETPDSPVAPTVATGSTQTASTPPTPNWEAMANSSKAGVEPTTPGTESPTTTAYEQLSPSKLDSEAATGSEAQAFYEYMSNDPEAMLAVLQGALREDDAEKRSDKLRAIGPMIKSWIDRNVTPR